MTQPYDKVAETGWWGSVVFVGHSDGSVPALEYLDTLVSQAQGQFAVRAEKLAAAGRISNEEQFKKITDDNKTPAIWEIKLSPGPGYRFYCWQEGRVWFVCHGTQKPRGNKGYQPEIKRARAVYESRRRKS